MTDKPLNWMFIMRLLLASLLFLGLFVSLPVPAEETMQQNPGSGTADSWQHFKILVNTIDTLRERIKTLKSQLQNQQDDQEKQRLQEEIGQLQQDLQSLNTALEMLATI